MFPHRFLKHVPVCYWLNKQIAPTQTYYLRLSKSYCLNTFLRKCDRIQYFSIENSFQYEIIKSGA